MASKSGKRSKRGEAKTTDGAASNATPDEQRFIDEHQEGLSKTTQHAKWIHSPDEHEDRPGQSLATRSHDVIQHWAEARHAHPATVGAEDGQARVLRLDFPGFEGKGGSLREIDWEEWFKPFDERELVFIFQEHRADGSQSNFFRLDSPEREQA
jgi:hypothetical protein